MEIDDKRQALVDKISAATASVLQDGEVYYSSPIRTQYGSSGGSMYRIADGMLTYDGHKEVEEAVDGLRFGEDLFALTQTFPANQKLRFTFTKGEGMKAEVCTPDMLLEDIERELKKEMIDFKAHTLFAKFEFFSNKELELSTDMVLVSPEKKYDFDFAFAEDELKCLYHALDPQPTTLHLKIENNVFSAQSPLAFPQYGIAEINEAPQELTLDDSTIEPIYEFLESGDAHKISVALAALNKNKKFYQQAEKRYLPLLKARLNEEEATLADFATGMLNKVEVKLLQSKNISETFLSFSYMNDHESKVLVDFIGAMMRSTFDVKAYIAAANAATEEEELQTVLTQYSANLLTAIKAEAAVHPTGWFSQALEKLSGMKLEKVMFEKTSFSEANKSLVLNEYMFFLGLVSSSSLFMDIHQSDTPNLSEVFWLLPQVPRTNWSDVTPNIPRSPLEFERTAKQRIGDFGSWETIYNP